MNSGCFDNTTPNLKFWKFTVFQLMFDSPQVKRDLISSITDFVFEKPRELANDLRLKILENEEISGRSQNWVEARLNT